MSSKGRSVCGCLPANFQALVDARQRFRETGQGWTEYRAEVDRVGKDPVLVKSFGDALDTLDQDNDLAYRAADVYFDLLRVRVVQRYERLWETWQNPREGYPRLAARVEHFRNARAAAQNRYGAILHDEIKVSHRAKCEATVQEEQRESDFEIVFCKFLSALWLSALHELHSQAVDRMRVARANYEKLQQAGEDGRTERAWFEAERQWRPGMNYLGQPIGKGDTADEVTWIRSAILNHKAKHAA
jgi:hypothetical protein